MKQGLSPADILFNGKLKTRMLVLLETDVSITGDLQIYRVADKAKQKTQYDLGLRSCQHFMRIMLYIYLIKK